MELALRDQVPGIGPWFMAPFALENVKSLPHHTPVGIQATHVVATSSSEIYAVRVRNRIVLSRVMERDSDILLLLSDQGKAEIEALRAEGGKARSLIVGRVVAAIRPLQYSVVKPTSRGGEDV